MHKFPRLDKNMKRSDVVFKTLPKTNHFVKFGLDSMLSSLYQSNDQWSLGLTSWLVVHNVNWISLHDDRRALIIYNTINYNSNIQLLILSKIINYIL